MMHLNSRKKSVSRIDSIRDQKLLNKKIQTKQWEYDKKVLNIPATQEDGKKWTAATKLAKRLEMAERLNVSPTPMNIEHLTRSVSRSVSRISSKRRRSKKYATRKEILSKKKTDSQQFRYDKYVLGIPDFRESSKRWPKNAKNKLRSRKAAELNVPQHPPEGWKYIASRSDRSSLPRPSLPRSSLPRPSLPRSSLPRSSLPRPSLPRPLSMPPQVFIPQPYYYYAVQPQYYTPVAPTQEFKFSSRVVRETNKAKLLEKRKQTKQWLYDRHVLKLPETNPEGKKWKASEKEIARKLAANRLKVSPNPDADWRYRTTSKYRPATVKDYTLYR